MISPEALLRKLTFKLQICHFAVISGVSKQIIIIIIINGQEEPEGQEAKSTASNCNKNLMHV